MKPSPHHSSERPTDLLRRWQEEHDRDALNDLLRGEIERLKGKIERKARWMLTPTAAASDVAQDAACGLLGVREAPQFANSKALRSYLWNTAWHLLVQQFRRAGPTVERIDDVSTRILRRALATTGGVSAIEAKEQSVVFDLVLNLLRSEDREILRLVYFERRSIGEVAESLGIAPNAGNMRLVRARRRLAERLVQWSESIG